MPEDIEKVALDEAALDAIVTRITARIADSTKVLAPPEEPEWAKQLKAQVAELAKPERAPVESGGIKDRNLEDKPVPITGGFDRFTFVGGTDAERATNLFLVKSICETQRGYRPSARLAEVLLASANRAVRETWQPLPSYVTEGTHRKAVDPDRMISQMVGELKDEARTKAMTSTGANAGDEWVPNFATSELWQDIHLATAVAANIRRVNMPTNPYDLPTLDSSIVWKYASSENTAVTATDPNTGKATLTARKIQAEVDFSGEVTEDSIVPIVATLRSDLVRSGAQAIDDQIVHGDTETAGTGNVNSDDAAPTAGDQYLAQNGLRRFTLVTNTAQVSNVAAALSTTNFTTIRGLLGKYGSRPSELLIITGQSTLNTMYDITQVKTIDVYGPNATIVQGELARFFGIPILLSEAIPLATTDKVAADGKYTTTSPSTNDTLGWLLLVNRTQWTSGFRREFQIESFRDIQKDQNILVASFRMAVIPSGIATTHTAIGRNITV